MKLRADQYELLRENSLYDIYVNKYGDVCLSQLNQIPDPSTCTIFATTFWSKDLPVDAEGYPTFQGVRGVCAKIFSSSPLMNPHSSSRNAFWTETALVMKNLFLKTSIPGTGSLSLSELLLLRQEKYSQLAALDRKSSSRENFTEPTRQLSLTEITGLARGGESEKTILQKKFQSLLEGAKKTLSIVMTRQKSTSLSPVSCQSSTPSSLKELESEEGDEKISKGRLRKEIKELSRILRSYPPVLPEY